MQSGKHAVDGHHAVAAQKAVGFFLHGLAAVDGEGENLDLHKIFFFDRLTPVLLFAILAHRPPGGLRHALLGGGLDGSLVLSYAILF